MKLIFDTSIWIEYFKGKDNYFDQCQYFIEKGEVFAIEIIFAELMQGAINKREVDIIKSYFEVLPQINISQLYIKACDFSRNEKLHSKGIGLIDAAIIKATIDSGSKLWTLDKKIVAYLASEFLFEGN